MPLSKEEKMLWLNDIYETQIRDLSYLRNEYLLLDQIFRE
jgi:hypothetical protein